MLIDISVNLMSSQFRNDREAVLKRAADAGVAGMLVTATNLQTTVDAIELCTSTHQLFCTAGVHPHDAINVEADWTQKLAVLLRNPVVHAVGETGLDFNRNFSPPATQVDVFCAQIRLAQQVNKPLFVHDRESKGVVLRLLTEAATLPPTVIHCFTGSREELNSYLDADFYIGITGWVADQNRGAELRAMISEIPLDRLLLETDAPFLRPHNVPADFIKTHEIPSKHKRRNEPALLPYVLDAVTEQRPEERAEILAAVTANANKLFGFSQS